MVRSILVHLTETNSTTKSIFKTTQTRLLVIQTMIIKEGAKISLSERGLSTTREMGKMRRLLMVLKADVILQAKTH